ncbi:MULTISPECIES: Sec-independent protein translocase protein TatB [Vitreoscilla]|uniref:Sec-independent protein translocase protein TatB n=1 Tax=Vitreoscilla stercoraria TaxID=61 RepID=A0ABY4EE56_VITST|nr:MULTISPECIES: Sec-independent protein translocase protein TatB [Vitreoscilla]AUZ05477.1 Sec-independent translocase TatB [Vitreoscilla sp. C1]UOO93225.1 Sec-independent protein translocase protein TatB [Vitreoscilla stercoraria]
MFELSFGEILLFTTVALIVLGPERLPVLARFLGRSLAKIQNMVHNAKAELGADMGLQDFQQMKADLQASAQSLKDDLQQQAQQIQQDIQPSLPSWHHSHWSQEEDEDMLAERVWTAQQQQHLPKTTLAQQSRQRRKNIRPYQHINPRAKRIGARRQHKQISHG